MGPTQVPEVWEIAQYKLKAVDFVDETGRLHDMMYDGVHASAEHPDTWATTPIDEFLINRNKEVMKLYRSSDNPTDPFNGQKITHHEFMAAKLGLTYFSYKVRSSIAKISDWMELYYPNLAHKGRTEVGTDHTAQRYNYELFLKRYIIQDGQGMWKLNNQMWKKDSSGNMVPKPPKE